ncbi:20-hydroxy-prefusarin hydrolase FUS2 [Paramyrothecium foliicola]|nr:20-hydroxy-prefusarin hydrolase FUS2 [Paramyrothecium foliicola]
MASSNYTLQWLSDDHAFHFQILRALSMSIYDGADLGEVLVASHSIIPKSLESFSNAFIEVAESVYKRAKSLANSKFPASARTAFFSAATYFRAADFYLHENPSDPRIFDYWGKQTAAFDAGLATLTTPNERVTISTPDFDIPGIWFAPDDSVEQRPTIIMFNGYDGSQEEMYHAAGVAALERGYNVLTIEGPGQPSVRRYQEVGFTHEWEKVVTPAVDYLLSRSDDVDPNSIGLFGFSFGGFLAPRAAAFEHRLAAVMAIDGVWDFGARVRHDFGEAAMRVYNSGNKTAFDALAQRYFEPDAPTELRWGLGQGLWAFNTRSAYEFVTLTAAYTLEHVVDKIKTPVFVAEGQHDPASLGQPEKLAKALGGCGHYHLFRAEDLAAEHCGMGALKQQNQVVLDWFQGILDSERGCTIKKC